MPIAVDELIPMGILEISQPLPHAPFDFRPDPRPPLSDPALPEMAEAIPPLISVEVDGLARIEDGREVDEISKSRSVVINGLLEGGGWDLIPGAGVPAAVEEPWDTSDSHSALSLAGESLFADEHEAESLLEPGIVGNGRQLDVKLPHHLGRVVVAPGPHRRPKAR